MVVHIGDGDSRPPDYAPEKAFQKPGGFSPHYRCINIVKSSCLAKHFLLLVTKGIATRSKKLLGALLALLLGPRSY